MSIKNAILFFSSVLFVVNAQAADTLKINLQQADSLFLVHNYYLLASSLKVEAQEAQIVQAKLYPNPIFSTLLTAYDPVNDKAFHVNSTGHKEFQLEQLLVLGGKRKSSIAIAELDAKIALLEFHRLVQQLKFQLHNDLYKLRQQQILLDRYSEQLSLLDTILTAHEAQVAKGNIPLQELVRLKGVYLNLNNERATLLTDYLQVQSNLQILLHTTKPVLFEHSKHDVDKYLKTQEFDRLLNEALVHQPNLLIAQQEVALASQHWQYQKRMAIPDINLFVGYDQRSGAFDNQINAGIAIPLPIWDRNQGNIKSSALRLKATQYLLEAHEIELIVELQNTLTVYEHAMSEYQKAMTLYNEDFDITFNGMLTNFKKRNISLIEFVDFFEAYNDVLAEMGRITTHLVQAAEQLNLLVGKEVF
jgi:cobalt-zinc-cadmium efflux system outer membrane protein